MGKNIFLLAALTWMSFSYAESKIVHDSMAEAEAYRIEKASPEHEAKREVAGGKIKKRNNKDAVKVPSDSSEKDDSEVRYWQYSE